MAKVVEVGAGIRGRADQLSLSAEPCEMRRTFYRGKCQGAVNQHRVFGQGRGVQSLTSKLQRKHRRHRGCGIGWAGT